MANNKQFLRRTTTTTVEEFVDGDKTKLEGVADDLDGDLGDADEDDEDDEGVDHDEKRPPTAHRRR